MTPGARVSAASEILDKISAGAAAEQALTAWSRGSRFAGSKDRAAVRDHVFDVLRARRSLGDGTGRALMMQLLLRDGADLDAHFNGEGHAPAPLNADEEALCAQPLAVSEAAACDLPDWLWPLWQDSLGADAQDAALAQRGRADVFLRVNQRRGSVEDAAAALAAESITTEPHSTVSGCLRVIENARRVKHAATYAEGLVELQDAASQFAIAAVPVTSGARVLDYCAGGGGKALAFADQYQATVFAHDISPKRMTDLPVRAARAQVNISCLTAADFPKQQPFDVVFCDAPCSGSGTWRRTPDAKWRLTPERLKELQQMQAEVLDAAAPLVGPNGVLAYATCSVLQDENDVAIDQFLARHPEWCITIRHQLLPGPDGDGFFLCCLARQ
jgi:16S rRNA (cytosine967-C5)-methyltransferase